MPLKYLEKDQKRIDKKMEELNDKLDNLEHQAQLQRLKRKYEKLKESGNPEDELMSELYQDLIKLEKRAKR
jgi:ribonuclease HIII